MVGAKDTLETVVCSSCAEVLLELRREINNFENDYRRLHELLSCMLANDKNLDPSTAEGLQSVSEWVLNRIEKMKARVDHV